MPQDQRVLPRFEDRLSYLYAERCVVEREKSAIALVDQEGMCQVPIASLALLMLGPGTKISHAAIDVLAKNRCLVAWVGEGAVRFYAWGAAPDRPAAWLLQQAELACDPVKSLRMACKLFAMRFGEFAPQGVSLDALRAREAELVRREYAAQAERFGVHWEHRETELGPWAELDAPNRALSTANSCLYGVCHAAVVALGLCPALGFLHRGSQLSFVYDVADLYKSTIALPAAFRAVVEQPDNLERAVRLAMRDRFLETRFVSKVVADLEKLFEGITEGSERSVKESQNDGVGA